MPWSRMATSGSLARKHQPNATITSVGREYRAGKRYSKRGLAYLIVVHSRRAEVTPTGTGDPQTGGGSIVVEQPGPNTVIIAMGGSDVWTVRHYRIG